MFILFIYFSHDSPIDTTHISSKLWYIKPFLSKQNKNQEKVILNSKKNIGIFPTKKNEYTLLHHIAKLNHIPIHHEPFRNSDNNLEIHHIYLLTYKFCLWLYMFIYFGMCYPTILLLSVYFFCSFFYIHIHKNTMVGYMIWSNWKIVNTNIVYLALLLHEMWSDGTLVAHFTKKDTHLLINCNNLINMFRGELWRWFSVNSKIF